MTHPWLQPYSHHEHGKAPASTQLLENQLRVETLQSASDPFQLTQAPTYLTDILLLTAVHLAANLQPDPKPPSQQKSLLVKISFDPPVLLTEFSFSQKNP